MPFFVTAVVFTSGLAASPAVADDARPMVTVSSGQNLPPLATSTEYFAGPGFASDIDAYQASGKYAADRAKVVAEASDFLRAWLREECANRASCTPAIVFDIDDTLVSWYPVLETVDFVSNQQVSSAAIDGCLTPKIRSTAALFDQAKRLGVTVFLITGRPDTYRAPTAACLTKLGLTGYRQLTMRAADQMSLTAEAYKSAARKKIEDRGFRIALAIGDQVSDSSGGYTDGAFVLPNPMYFIP
jgi:hypothetical protein